MVIILMINKICKYLPILQSIFYNMVIGYPLLKYKKETKSTCIAKEIMLFLNYFAYVFINYLVSYTFVLLLLIQHAPPPKFLDRYELNSIPNKKRCCILNWKNVFHFKKGFQIQNKSHITQPIYFLVLHVH